MYELRFDIEAIEFLENLPKEIKKQIFNKIRSTQENPFHFFGRLVKRKTYKLKVGKYRIIADINQRENFIHITQAGHRNNIYDKV